MNTPKLLASAGRLLYWKITVIDIASNRFHPQPGMHCA